MICIIKKAFLAILSVLFSLILIAISAIKISENQAIADTGENNATISSLIVLDEKINYYLAYPGILPDNPLYWLKMIRDRIVLWLTFDSVSRWERLLLYADKRIGAGKILIEGGKNQLGITTITKAEKYLEQAANQYLVLKAVNKDNSEISQKQKNAVQKHQELLKALIKILPDQQKSAIDDLLKKVNVILEKIN